MRLSIFTRFSRSALITLILVVLPTASQADSNLPTTLDLTLLEVPFNTGPYFPTLFSPRQSLGLSTSFYQSAHQAISDANSPRAALWWIIGFDFLAEYIPLGSSWMHEEWHRSVMLNRGIGSFNDVNTWPIGRGLISVSQVEDADLARLKRDHPADQVRLSSAGMEAQISQNLHIEQKHFFEGQETRDGILLWINNVNTSFYLGSCNSSEADDLTDQQNRDDGADVRKRDFTGLDCTAWVYDLFRPDENYSVRGNHPSGVGYDRYIKHSDLSEKEQRFLDLQTKLSLLNFVDPFLFGKSKFHSDSVSWNFRLAHFLTSFGGTVDAIAFLELDRRKFLLTIHNGMTDTRYLPGISFERIEQELPWDGQSLSYGLTLWPQPTRQRVESPDTQTMILGKALWQKMLSKSFAVNLGLEAKNEGWVAGNVYLDRNLSAWVGIKTALN